jgi:predicted GNAT superfamily acetyltransferase
MIKDTLFYQYANKRDKINVLETDEYFVFYKIINNEFFVSDCAIHESVRGQGKCREFFKEVIKLAKEKKCEHVTAHLHLFDDNFHITLAVMLKLGFRVLKAQNDSLLIANKISGEPNGKK